MKNNHIAGAGKMMLAALALLFGLADAQTHIYRSVQPGVTAALSATGGTLTISGTTATFSLAQPDSIGVGDAIQYDSDGNSSIDAVAFIHGRTSSTVYTVANAAGGTPTAVTGDEDWDIFRAYISLSNWESGTENTGIDAAVRAFDGGNRNIDTANEFWYIACYPGVDAVQVNISGWTTSATDRILIYTPILASEVGRPMRHRGVWSSYYYNLVPAVTSAQGILNNVGTNHVEVRGIQIYMQANGSAEAAIKNLSIGAELSISKCILRGNLTQSSSTRFVGIHQGGSGVVMVKNCFIYDFMTPSTTADAGILFQNTGVAYNNTIVNCAKGIDVDGGAVWANNNIVQDCAVDYEGTFQAGTSHNVSDLTNAPGTDAIEEVSLTFKDAANDDFHLAAGDVTLIEPGLDIFDYDPDSFRTLTDDIDEDTRVAWNRGADEFQAEPTVSGGDFLLRRRAVR